MELVPDVSDPCGRGWRTRQSRALLGTFVGDALGMPFEGAVEMVEGRRGRGTYTDHTQMMIALAESDAAHLARAFLNAYEADRGYGGGTRRVFELWRSGVAVADAAGPVFAVADRAAMVAVTD